MLHIQNQLWFYIIVFLCIFILTCHFWFCVGLLVFWHHYSKLFASNLLTLIVPHEDYSRNASYALNWISAGITILARISFLDNCFSFGSRDVGNIGIICSALCICFLTFSLNFYIVHPSSIYGFWLHFSYIQTYLIDIST
jgi:hypothetical protein